MIGGSALAARSGKPRAGHGLVIFSVVPSRANTRWRLGGVSLVAYLTNFALVFAVCGFGMGVAQLSIWIKRRKGARTPASRRVLLEFIGIDWFVQTLFWGLFGSAFMTSMSVWWCAPIALVAIAKVLFIDFPLERWRDQRIAAYDAAFLAKSSDAA